MTNTDKIEIKNLLNSMKEMCEYAKNMNKTYVDNRIVEFATLAKEDYIANKNYIKDVIHKNLPLFFNLNNFEVSTSGCSTEGYSAMRGKKFCINIGNNVYVVIRFNDFETIKNTGYKICFKVRDLSIIDIWWRTSDCIGDKDNYSICSAWDLVDYPRNSVAKLPYETPKSVNNWEILYNLSAWTREKNVLLVRKFKELLRDKVDEYRKLANTNETKIEQMTKISMNYVKVDL